MTDKFDFNSMAHSRLPEQTSGQPGLRILFGNIYVTGVSFRNCSILEAFSNSDLALRSAEVIVSTAQLEWDFFLAAR